MLLPIKHNLQHALRHHSKRVNYKHTLYNLRPSVASQPAANILIHLSHRVSSSFAYFILYKYDSRSLSTNLILRPY